MFFFFFSFLLGHGCVPQNPGFKTEEEKSDKEGERRSHADIERPGGDHKTAGKLMSIDEQTLEYIQTKH